MPTTEGEPPKKGAPRYIVAYCSIMTLLLAFFIILQAFATVQEEGLFYAGRGSFVRALKTFGLGGLWEPRKGGVTQGPPGARYRSTEGQEARPRQRRIDPEAEEAQRALEALEEQFDVRRPPRASGWCVTLPTPWSYQSGKVHLSPEEEEFCQELARRIVPLLLARAFVIRIGGILSCSPEEELEQTEKALQVAQQFRDRFIQHMTPQVRPLAADRVYSFCRKASEREQTALTAQTLTIDILLTKPYIHQLRQERTPESESPLE